MYGWIKDAIKETIEIRKKFGQGDRHFISSVTQGEGSKKAEIVFYRKENRYFITANDKPVATALNKADCVKKAFINGDINDETYVLFTRGHKASVEYRKDQIRKEKRYGK